MKQIVFLVLLITCNLISLSGIGNAATKPAVEAALPTPSSRAQTLYESARSDLLQIRILLKNGRTQTSVGSGFFVGASNLVVTNYHVVSQLVMHPKSYIGEFIDTNGAKGKVKLLAVDALHDLAVVRVDRKGKGYFKVPNTLPTLSQGQYLYSLGNPLDLGFAISEGTYNSVIKRGFYDQLMFTGPINAGMSGGPNITENGQVAGVNVSKRLDGELVSFLVPVKYVVPLIKKAKSNFTASKNAQASETKPAFKKEVGLQLIKHQHTMLDTILAQPLTAKTLGEYQVPVRESNQIRCWGSSNDDTKDSLFDLSTINCAMESAVFISNQLHVGQISIRHEYIKATGMGALRASVLQSQSFKNERFGSSNRHLTAPTCKESFITNDKLPMRAVLCVRAYREFEGLYNFALLTASTDQSKSGLQSRLDAKGVSYDNGLRIAKQFLDGLGKTPSLQNKEAKK